MRRVAWVWAAVAAAVAIGGCGESRSAAAAAGAPSGCANCHSAPGEAAPFRDLAGLTDPAQRTVGAHDRHLHGSLSAPISCTACHTTPRSITDPGHLEDSPGDVSFGTLARTGGASPTYEAPPSGGGQPSCSTVYCHGAFPGGNAGNAPVWTAARTEACGTCHELPPPTGRHVAHVGISFNGTAIQCSTCHGPVVPATHVNGVKNVAIGIWQPATRTCARACHDPRGW
jgi:predicted CxxxxCH...CXXCH cytochrome family protein